MKEKDIKEKDTSQLLEELETITSILPKEKSIQKLELFDNNIHLYGPAGVGKSSFCARDWMFFFNCEGGLGGLSVYQEEIISWGKFKEYARAFLKEKHNFRACCIDRIEVLFSMCTWHISNTHEIEHPSDMDWGKGWSLLHDEFLRPIMALSLSKYGLFTISHDTDKTIKTRTGEYTKTTPSLSGSGPNSCTSVINSIADLIIHMDYDDNGKRILEIKGNKNLIAKSRHKGMEFEKIELPDDPDLSFALFEKLWNEKVKGGEK